MADQCNSQGCKEKIWGIKKLIEMCLGDSLKWSHEVEIMRKAKLRKWQEEVNILVSKISNKRFFRHRRNKRSGKETLWPLRNVKVNLLTEEGDVT